MKRLVYDGFVVESLSGLRRGSSNWREQKIVLRSRRACELSEQLDLSCVIDVVGGDAADVLRSGAARR